MDRKRIPIFLLCAHVVAAAGVVPPPTNVTFHCHNMQNTFSWGYDGSTEGLKFMVFIGAQTRKPVTHFVDPPVMSIDLSEFSDPDNDAYVVMVSAVKGGEESGLVPEEGIQYSYFKDSPAPVRCSLDLPLVNVTTVEENYLHFSFTHPGVLYPTSRRKRQKKSHESQDRLPVFEYHIEVLNQKASHTYHCTERKCQGKLHVPGSEESYCLNITGEMKKMSVRATQKFCSKPLEPPGIDPLAYIIPIIFVIAIILIVSMVFYKKTKGLTSGPSSLNFPYRRPRPVNLASPVSSDFSRADVSPTCLIPPEQQTSNDSGTYRDEEVRLRLGVNDNENENENEPEVAEGQQGAPEDGYTKGSYLENDEDEEFPTAYERRETPANSTQN